MEYATKSWSRHPGQSPALCVQCGERAPAKPRRVCKECRAASEKEARKARIEEQSKLPCVVDGCQNSRAVTPTQVKPRCAEHQRVYAADLRRSKGVPARKVRPDVPAGMWWCSRCEQIKPIETCVRKGDGWGRCKPCESAMLQERIARDPEAVRRTTRESARRHRQRRLYGVDRTEIEAQAVRQGGRCASCKELRDLVPDHDHAHPEPTTRDAVRGLLCDPCNLALGLLQDDPTKIEALLEFIRNPPRPFVSKVSLRRSP